MNKCSLIDKIEYYLKHSKEDDVLKVMFSKEEWELLDTIRKFEDLRASRNEKDDLGEDKAGRNERFLNRLEAEKDISFQLKEKLFCQMNKLLEAGSPEAWMDILAWYQLVNGKQLVHRFWEMHVLKTLLDIFTEELKTYCENGSPISVLRLHNLDELTEAYFKTIFYLRRIEYDIEPMNEIMNDIKKQRFSVTFISIILMETKIYDKEKVLEKIESWCGRHVG